MERYPFTPFKAVTIRPIPQLSREDRCAALERASYNIFNLLSRHVTIDFLTDSGTGALSVEQQAAKMRADPSYAGSESWERFEKSVSTFLGSPGHIIPVHQGRGAENVLADVFLAPGDVVVSNTLFDTTRANFMHRGAHCIDLPWSPPSVWNAVANDPDTITDPNDPMSGHRFKGDIAIGQLKYELGQYRDRVKLIVLTLTNNSGGGQPISMRNIEAAAALAHEHRIPLLLDACRIAENAYFVWKTEFAACGRKESLEDVLHILVAEADLLFMSTKKDGLSWGGGFIFVKQAADGVVSKLASAGILKEGFKTYGGMAPETMESVAQGLYEVLDLQYLEHRIRQVAYLHVKLKDIGYPLVKPPGGHAVYIDAGALLPHIPRKQFPGQALAVELYREGGIRSVEIGTLMFHDHARDELVRLAIPRRVYDQSHMDYVAEIAARVFEKRKTLRGFAITDGAIGGDRHFSCKLKPL